MQTVSKLNRHLTKCSVACKTFHTRGTPLSGRPAQRFKLPSLTASLRTSHRHFQKNISTTARSQSSIDDRAPHPYTRSDLDTFVLAKFYDSDSPAQAGLEIGILKDAAIPLHSSVIDIGGGTGRFALEAAKTASQVFLLDVSEERIAIAQSKIDQSVPAIKNVVARAGDANNISEVFPGIKVDFAFFNSSLHWVNDRSQALRDTNNLLKEGGRLTIAIPCAESLPAYELMEQTVLAELGYPPGSGFGKYWTQRELRAELKQSGFEKVTIRFWPMYVEKEDPQALLQWLDASTSGNFLAHLGRDERDKAVDIFKRVAERYRVEGGKKLRIQVNMMIAQGVKGYK